MSKGHYHEKEGIMQQTWNIEMMKQRLWEQVPETCEIREIQLPSNQTLVSSFPVAMGRALALNHLTTALTGLAIVFMFLCIKADDGWSYVSFTLIEGENDKLTGDSGPRNWQVGQTLLDGLHFGLILPT